MDYDPMSVGGPLQSGERPEPEAPQLPVDVKSVGVPEPIPVLDGKVWKVNWRSHEVTGDRYEVFTAPNGNEYVRALPGEVVLLSVHPGTRFNLPLLQLVKLEDSARVRRALRKERRVKRELKRQSERP